MKKRAFVLLVVFLFATASVAPVAHGYSAMDVAGLADSPAQEPPTLGKPSLPALPGTGQTISQFALDDRACKEAATQIVGNPEEIAQDKAVGSAIAGMLLSGIFGGLLGAAVGGRRSIGAGAAIGAGAGLSTGAITGAIAGESAGDKAQYQWDQKYWACMYEKGHKVPAAQQMEQQQTRPPAPAIPPPPPPPPPKR